MSSNPLHALIEQLGQFIRAVWRWQQASTKEERQESFQAWSTLKAPFWPTHRIPAEAVRNLADPALAWCGRRGFGGQDHIDTIERAVHFITELAKLTVPCAMPSLYANEDEAEKEWKHQGELLMTALASQDALRRLAALTGDEWKGDGRMPWDADPPPFSPTPESTPASPAPTKPAASNVDRIDTRPDSPMPPDPLIEAAMRDIPQTLADMDNTSDYYAPIPAPRQRIVLHHSLVSALGKKHGHGKAAAAWAIHRLIERGMLTARYGSSDMPSVLSRDGIWHGGERYEVRDLKYSLIESTPELWDWWAAMAPESWHMSETSEEDGSIISRADAIHEAEKSDMESRKQAAERRDRCLEKLKQLGSATSKLHQSQDRWTQNPLPDPSPYLEGLFSAMAEVCRALRLDGFEKDWQRVDREATFNHYRSGFGPPEKAKVAFEWGCRLLDRGFQDQLRQEDIDTTWNKPALRYGFNIVQILLFGVLGEQRIEFQKEPLSSTDCSRVQADTVEYEPAYTAEEQPWLTPLPLTKDMPSGSLRSLVEKIDVVLITATDTELAAVLRKLEPYPRRQTVLKMFVEQETYYLGKFGVCVAAVTKCRMGSLDSGGATLATEHAQRVWRPRAIVMVGIALGKDPEKQKIADVLVASQVISYEPQRVGEKQTVNRGPIPPANPTLLNRFDIVPHWSFCRPDGSKCKREVGPLLSGEKMVDAAAFKASILDRYPQAIGGEMEGVGLAAAAVRHGVPWILVKAICDWADGKKHDRHQALAAAAAVSLVHHVLSQTDVLHGLHKPNQTW